MLAKYPATPACRQACSAERRASCILPRIGLNFTMGRMEGNPILRQWEAGGGETTDERIAGGFVSDEMGQGLGVRRRTFEIAGGKRAYVYKEVFGRSEAERTMDIYRTFREAGLPVASFSKIIKRKKEEAPYLLAMEDLTDGDRYALVEVGGNIDSVRSVFLSLQEGSELPEKLIRALAVIHNNGIYDFHPGLSIALRVEKGGQKTPLAKRVKDFVVIDYANFERREWLEKEIEKNPRLETTFEKECVDDVGVLVKRVTADRIEREKLLEYYERLRKEGARMY